MYTQLFAKQRFSQQEQWIKDNLLLEVISGSHAYGCQTKDSDFDVVGITMNQHQHLFPQNYGYILGFDQMPNFENKECKADNKITLETGKDVEAAWHSLSNFFYLVSKGSPNLTEILFVHPTLVTYQHKLGTMIRDRRRDFLSLRMFFSFKGYCFQQLSRIRKEAKRWKETGTCDNKKRTSLYEESGYDRKMAYHVLRLLDLIHQILTEGDMDLMRNREECKKMRSGEWGDFDTFNKFVDEKLLLLDKLSTNCISVAAKPQTGVLHELLKNCIEEFYGSESKMVQNTEYVSAKEIKEQLNEIERKIDRISA